MVTWAYVSPLLGLALLFFAFVSFQTGESEWARRRRIQIGKMPTTRIAAAKDGQIVEVKGTVLADPDAPAFEAPLSGGPVVWACVAIWSRFRSGKIDIWSESSTTTLGGSFLLDDGSGELARVEVRGDIEMRLDDNFGTALPQKAEVPAHLAAFFERKRISRAYSDMRFLETVVREGDRLLVVGHARRERLPSADTYRGTAATRLVLFAGKRGLYLTRTMEAEQLKKARKDVPLGVLLLLAGLAVLGSGAWCIVQLVVAPK
ncbi:MAG: hypothetical protein ACXVCJ_26150 [Polyangiales bacterium]